MRIVALLMLAACGAPDTTLTNGSGDNEAVNGDGRLTVDKTEIVVADIVVGFSKSESFTVTSVGTSNLRIYEIRLVANPDEVFYFDEVEDIELAPEQTASYTVVADLDVAEPSEGQLRLRTSDPDNANLIIPLAAWPEGYVPPDDTGDTGGDTGTP